MNLRYFKDRKVYHMAGPAAIDEKEKCINRKRNFRPINLNKLKVVRSSSNDQ